MTVRNHCSGRMRATLLTSTLALLFAVACGTSSTTPSPTPTPTPCSVASTSSTTTFGADGGSGSIAVTARTGRRLTQADAHRNQRRDDGRRRHGHLSFRNLGARFVPRRFEDGGAGWRRAGCWLDELYRHRA